MYWLILFVSFVLSAWLVWRGVAARNELRMVGGILIAGTSILFFLLLEFWGEMLWFETLGHSGRFWSMLWAQGEAVVLGAALGFGGVYLLLWPVRQRFSLARGLSALAGGVGGVVWGTDSWDELVLFAHRVSTGLSEPILKHDAGFYLFVLPLLDQLFALLLWIAMVALLSAAALLFIRREAVTGRFELFLPTDADATASNGLPLYLTGAVLAAVLAVGKVLAAYHLLYSDWGVVAGPGWTDVHVRLPAYGVVALATLLLGLTPLLPSVRRRAGRWVARVLPGRAPVLGAVATVWLGIAGVWLLALGLLPAMIQWLVVEPNEITFEKPYIAHNIRFTRRGFGLHEVEERQFPAAEELTREMVRRNDHLLSEVRLWDWRALDAVYAQFQEIRLYYEFHDVDMDRYQIGDRYRQVMTSARELDPSNLPRQSQTFVNLRFKYTHGYGLTLAAVSDFTPDGLPDLLVKDIPPKSRSAELTVERPQIYYGELTDTPVVVNTQEEEFDHPSGERNVYIRYPGKGGVPLTNPWRKFVFGWKFDGSRFFLSSYPTASSRVMFHRQIRERVQTLAPFLHFDADPYIVLVNGQLYWILDAYTASEYYPYSQPFSAREVITFPDGSFSQRVGKRSVAYLEGKNYVRNSVKAVVNAFDGTVDFYVFDAKDPIVQAWRGVFPGLFKDRRVMPPELQAHARYPQDFLLAQGLVYAKYHMGDPAVFYNQEDLWVRATEKHYDHVEAVEPYYVMWQLPDSDRAEFVLILPFTPKNRQVLIGWIAALSDGDHYGRFLAYKFPKEKRVLGPQQVETKIDQDRFLSGQLTLWDQRGSKVIRGNVLAIPIEDTLVYVEPIYLQAETAAYPELRLVVMMHGDTLSYAETFDQALEGLFAVPTRESSRAAQADGTLKALAGRAKTAFEAYLQSLGDQRFEAAAEALRELRDTLEVLNSRVLE